MAQLNADKCFIFTDTETTGLDINFSQIIQVGSILTDEDIQIEDKQDLDCNLLPWIIPSPEAFLVHKKTSSLGKSSMSHYDMMRELRDKWLSWSKERNPVFITYNGHRFDEELFRRQFYWNLLPPYITNTEGATRLDLLFTFQLIANFFPERLKIPTSSEGDISLKLTDWAEANQVSSEGAHDALEDCLLMVNLSKLVQKNAKEAWNASLKGSSKNGNLELVQSDPFTLLGEVVRKKKFVYPITYCGQNLKMGNEIAVVDLYADPNLLDELTDEELSEQIGGSGAIIRKLKINRSLPIISSSNVPNLNIFLDESPQLLKERAHQVRENLRLQNRISEILTNNQPQYPEPKYLEQTVYSGFASHADELWMERFSCALWEEKAKLIQGFGDSRYKNLAERIVCTNSPECMTKESMTRHNAFVITRQNDKGPWLNKEKALQKISKLMPNVKKEEKDILEKVRSYLNSPSQQ